MLFVEMKWIEEIESVFSSCFSVIKRYGHLFHTFYFKLDSEAKHNRSRVDLQWVQMYISKFIFPRVESFNKNIPWGLLPVARAALRE